MNLRPEAEDLLERVSNFLHNEVAPNETKFHEQIKTDDDRWNYFPEIVEELKEKAKSFLSTHTRCVTKEDYEARV